jgi:pimeloyl-ACP methyl ester carboxylesterase
VTLYIQESGNRDTPIIVFLHGGGVSGWMWDKQVRFFSDYHCLVPDLPGHGKSNKETYISIRDCSNKVIELIDSKSRGRKVIVVGFSLGAQIVVDLLSIKPEIVYCAVINSALVRPMKFVRSMIKPMVKMSMGLIKNRKFSKLQARALYIGEEYFERYYDNSKEISSDILTRLLQGSLSFCLPYNFKNAKARSLVLIGKKEKRIMKNSALDIINCNHNCIGYMVLKIGHGISFANPNLYNKIIKAWINNEILPQEIELIKK